MFTQSIMTVVQCGGFALVWTPKGWGARKTPGVSALRAVSSVVRITGYGSNGNIDRQRPKCSSLTEKLRFLWVYGHFGERLWEWDAGTSKQSLEATTVPFREEHGAA